MRQQIVGEMRGKLNRMEETGQVDMSILDSLGRLYLHLNTTKSRWLEESSDDSFYFYMGVQSVELILGRMEERFKDARAAGDNPKVAKDSLAILPAIDGVLEMAEVDEISKESVKAMLGRVWKLRDTASDNDLLESIETDRALIDKKSLEKNFTRLMDKLDIKQDGAYGDSND